VEVETEETEGLTDEAASAEEANGEAEGDGHRRKRRRRRRGRGGEAREGAFPRDEGDAVRASPEMAEGAVSDDAETEEDEGDEQPGLARAEQGANGERRPRRRGRRGGRRRRGGGLEDGLVGSISDELGPPSTPEASDAVADFDGGSPEPAPSLVEPEAVVPQPQPEERAQPETVGASGETEAAQEAEGAAARRRSTVREKVSFFTSPQPEAAPTPAPLAHSQPEPAPPAAPAEPEAAAPSQTQPRKAGWWSRRFGGGE
jgi:ribonuclease E